MDLKTERISLASDSGHSEKSSKSTRVIMNNNSLTHRPSKGIGLN
jgi:hypothetical protein